MKTQQTTRHTQRRFPKNNLLALACLASLAGAASDAQAQDLGQCLKNTASCGVNIAKTQIDLLAAATDVIAFTASHPHCIADIASGNFITIGVSSSMVGLAASGVLKQEGGSYVKYIYGQGGRPMVEALSSILPVPALSNLLKENSDELIGSAFEKIAGSIPVPATANNVHLQLDCGSAIAVAGQGMVGKVKSFVGHAKGAVKSCSAAASCFAGVLVDIVTDPVGAIGSAGEFLADGADAVKDAVFGGCKNQDTQLYFNTHFKPWQNDIAYKVIWGGNANAYNEKARELLNNCVSYYDGCDSDPDTAKRQCLVMSTGGVQTDGNAWISGKGLEQLVRTRQMELRIPQFLATDMKWALAQPTGGKDTAMLNQQFARLPAPLQPLVKAKFTFSIKSAREAAARKIMGFAPGYSGNGDFGGKDAKVVMADQSIGALMLAYVPAQGAENKSTNTKINDLYKQYIPNGDALLQQIEATTGESMGKAITEVVKQNGEAWNEALTNTQLQKMVKRFGDCKDAHKDAKKTCEKGISDAIQFVNNVMPNMGKANNYEGIVALGEQNQAFKNYVKFIQDADATVSKHVVQSAMAIIGDGPIITAGTATAPSGAAAANLGAKPPTPPPAPGQVVMLTAPGQQPGGIPSTQARPDTPAARPFGMPGAPTMSVIPVNAPKPPAQAIIAVAPAGAAPGAAPGVAAGLVLPFDAAAYRKVREKQIEDEWMPKCAGQALCVNKVNEITDKLLAAEITALNSGKPLHTDKAAVTAFQNSLDPTYDPLFKDALPKVVVASQPPSGQVIVNNQQAPPKFVDKAPPFDASAYRSLRDKEIKAEWMPKCGGNASCLQRMSDITQNLVNRETTALTNGSPLHTDSAAVRAFQNSLDPTFDPLFKAAIPVVVTPAPVTGTATLSNKKPTFKPL